VFKLMLSCMAFREQPAIPPLAGEMSALARFVRRRLTRKNVVAKLHTAELKGPRVLPMLPHRPQKHFAAAGTFAPLSLGGRH
jgi:hypothetical protein